MMVGGIFLWKWICYRLFIYVLSLNIILSRGMCEITVITQPHCYVPIQDLDFQRHVCVLIRVKTVLYCDVRCVFRMKTVFGSSLPRLIMFGSFLPTVVCRRDHVLFTLFLFACAQWCPTHIVLCFLCLSQTYVLCSQCCQFLWIVHL